MFTHSVDPAWFPTCAVFDCDGILIDSERSWNAVQKQIFKEYGTELTPDIERQLVGAAAPAVARTLADKTLPNDATETAAEEHYQKILHHLMSVEHDVIRDGVQLIPGAREVMALLAEVMPVAVASNSSQKLLTYKVNHHQYSQYLQTWVGSDAVAQPKPAPDMYLEAIRRLGGNPADTLTFEDSATGTRAAQTAGTVTMVYTQDIEHAPAAQGHFDSFRDEKFLTQIKRWIELYREHHPNS
ncbi:HAD family hydrolase [Rothia sp. P6271]|uniref:HAD family hydrolase n=1 Tax=Rothia sp. P6271 TaxID=3402659 RepID=UPI003AC48D8B